jgi:hypothetical protein
LVGKTGDERMRLLEPGVKLRWPRGEQLSLCAMLVHVREERELR